MILVRGISSVELTNKTELSENLLCAFKIHRCARRAVLGPPLPSPSIFPSLSILFVTLCLPIFFPHVSSLTESSVYAVLSSTTRSPFFGVIWCHFCLIFSPRFPSSLLQSNPFTLSSNSLGHPRVLSLFFHLSVFLPLVFSAAPLPSPSLSVLLTCST